MHINLEAADNFSIQSYNNQEIKVGSINYQKSLIISKEGVISNWPVENLLALNDQLLEPLLCYRPKIIIIGHQQQGQFAPIAIHQKLSETGIGLETMTIGAACRTFNVLLNEQREVVIGIILKFNPNV